MQPEAGRVGAARMRRRHGTRPAETLRALPIRKRIVQRCDRRSAYRRRRIRAYRYRGPCCMRQTRSAAIAMMVAMASTVDRSRGTAPPQPALHPLRPALSLRDRFLRRPAGGDAASGCAGRGRCDDGRRLLSLTDLRSVADGDAHWPAPVSEPLLDQPRHPRLGHPHHGPRPRRGRLPAGADRAPTLDGAGPAARLHGAGWWATTAPTTSAPARWPIAGS